MCRFVLITLIFLQAVVNIFAQNIPTFPQFNSGSTGSQAPSVSPHGNNSMANPVNVNQSSDHKRLQHEEIMEILNEERKYKPKLNTQLPSLSKLNGTESYYKAFNEICSMLDGKEKLDIIKATFVMENAYYGNKFNYTDYKQSIDRIASFCIKKMLEEGQDTSDNTAKNLMLFRFFTDTLVLKDKSKKHFPTKYDFNDYAGDADRTNTFVMKVLKTNTGQCQNLPELYLNVAQAMNTEAYLAFAPQHSYIKFKDKGGVWYNVELTNGRITSDAFILGSGYIKAEAIQNKLYMQPMNKKEIVAHYLDLLAHNYIGQFGWDSFVIKCIDKNQSVNPKDVFSMLRESDYYTVLFNYVLGQAGKPSPQALQTNYPEAWQIYQKRNAIYKGVDDSGYEDMPKDAYEKWLSSVNDEAQKREHEKKKSILIKQIQIKD